MTIFLVTIHILVSILMIIMVLLQAGKGSSLGAALGGGGSQTLFGPAGSGNILTKFTTGLAIIFMVTSISLAHVSGKNSSSSVMSNIKQEQPIKADSAADSSSTSSDVKSQQPEGDK